MPSNGWIDTIQPIAKTTLVNTPMSKTSSKLFSSCPK